MTLFIDRSPLKTLKIGAYIMVMLWNEQMSFKAVRIDDIIRAEI